jgi:hypothetical protein
VILEPEKSAFIYPLYSKGGGLIKNPAGVAWNGEIEIGAEADGNGFKAKVPIQFRSGEKMKEIEFDFPDEARAKLGIDRSARQSWFIMMSGEGEGSFQDNLRYFPQYDKLSTGTAHVKLEGTAEVEADVKLDTAPQDLKPNPSGAPSVRLRYRFGKGWRFARVEPNDRNAAHGKHFRRCNSFMGAW